MHGACMEHALGISLVIIFGRFERFGSGSIHRACTEHVHSVYRASTERVQSIYKAVAEDAQSMCRAFAARVACLYSEGTLFFDRFELHGARVQSEYRARRALFIASFFTSVQHVQIVMRLINDHE